MTWSIAPEPVDSPVAAALWRAYYTELERGIAARTGAELVPPSGQLLVARYAGEPAGSAGVRLLDPATA